MDAKFLSVRWLCGGLLIGVATVCLADAPQRKLPMVRIAPEMIQQTPQAMQLSTGLPYSTDGQYQPPNDVRSIPNGCAQNQASLCFDYRSGHAMYKPMRRLLPPIPGMTPHNLSIHRDKIVAEYSFK